MKIAFVEIMYIGWSFNMIKHYLFNNVLRNKIYRLWKAGQFSDAYKTARDGLGWIYTDTSIEDAHKWVHKICGHKKNHIMHDRR